MKLQIALFEFLPSKHVGEYKVAAKLADNAKRPNVCFVHPELQ